MSVLKYFFKLFIIIPLMIFNIACNAFDPCTQVEKYRLPSEDGIVDVVVSERDCGATTSKSKFIFIVPKGNSVNDETPVFIADNVKKLEVNWGEPKELFISYDHARIFNFTNFWHSKSVDNFNYEIRIREIPRSK